MKRIVIYITDDKRLAWTVRLRKRYNKPRAGISTLLLLAAKEAVKNTDK